MDSLNRPACHGFVYSSSQSDTSSSKAENVSIAAVAKPAPHTEKSTIERLCHLIHQRLEVMHDVAAWKFVNDKTVYDKEREEKVLALSKKAASEAGVDPDAYANFIQLQMNIAKDIQTNLHKIWSHNKNCPTNFKDLNSEIRPHLITIGGNMVELTAEHLTTYGGFDKQQIKSFVENIKGLSAENVSSLIETLSRVCLRKDCHLLLP